MLAGLAMMLMTAQSPFVLCLDPGHPSENGLGAVGMKVREVELVWDLSERVKRIFEQKYGNSIRVVLTKRSLSELVTNRARANIANRVRADLFLRIHADSGGVSGIATYFPDGQARVKGVLGPSLSVISRSQNLAKPFHLAVTSALGTSLPDLGCRSEKKTAIGRKQGALTGTVFSKVPVLLVEVCAVDNERDAAFVSTSSGREKLAESLVAGVLAVKNLVRPPH